MPDFTVNLSENKKNEEMRQNPIMNNINVSFLQRHSVFLPFIQRHLVELPMTESVAYRSLHSSSKLDRVGWELCIQSRIKVQIHDKKTGCPTKEKRHLV